MCTADKSSLRCEKCGLSGHVTEACRGGRRQTRSPSRSRWSGRSPSSSSESSSSSAEERRRNKKKEKKEKRKSREKKKNKSATRQLASSAASASASSRSTSRGNRHRAGRTPKLKKKIRDTVNNLEDCDVSETTFNMRASTMVEVSQQDKREDLLTTLDTGSKYNIVDEGEANTRSWHISKITEWEKPSLKCPDGRKLEIVGKTTLWLRLAKEEYKRKIDFFVTPHLQSEILVGLIDLKRLHWVSPKWPMDIEKWGKVFTNADNEDVVNKIDHSSSSDEEETEIDDSSSSEEEETENEEKSKENKAKEEADDEEEEGGTVDITDFTDLKTYKIFQTFQNSQNGSKT